MNDKFERWFLEMDTFLENLDNGFKAMNVGSLDVAELNGKMYSAIKGSEYTQSFANPAFADFMLGGGYGKLCSFMSYEAYSLIGYKFDKKSSLMEPFLNMYQDIRTLYETGKLTYDTFHNRIYRYLYESCEIFYEDRIRDTIVPRESAARRIVTKDGLGDVTYLYKYGEYITDTEIKTARFLNLLSQEKIDKMAEVFVMGYKKGFETTGRPFEKKKSVGIIYKVGFERLVKAEIEAFKALGLETALYRTPRSAVIRQSSKRNGFHGAVANYQADYDHARDALFFMDEKLKDKKLEAVRKAYEKYAAEADVYGGPAVMETFGEVPFDYKESKFVLTPADAQIRLGTSFMAEAASIANEYVKGEERSFTIIAYPTPDIGEDFKEIFAETVKLNTLDSDIYMNIQQKMIDVLNRSRSVIIVGAGENETYLTINLFRPQEPSTQENFENCVADVNIPLGEVFTSPRLEGTTGLLNVSRVFLSGFEYKDLKVEFKDGFVSGYSCSNFDDDKKGREYFKKNVLFDHDTLPMGEFAIGTNTVAYMMARKYNIEHLMPILIAEKTGPHFALGDTCYSHGEDVRVFNQNGREIIAKDNEVSVLRKTDPGKAYFNCHTDITIPYEEIGSLSAIGDDGEETEIIRSGRFVLPGTELLNEAFETNG